MDEFGRYAIYYAPPHGAFAQRAADWLGWDAQAGHARPQPDLPGLPRPADQLTRAPRRYGFHGTIRAPFRPQVPEAALIAALDDLARTRAPVICDGLVLRDLHGFVALVPEGEGTALSDLAAAVVRDSDPLRAPLSATEIARRRPEALSPRQRALLDLWGYPFVMEEFRFHLTLTDPLDPAETVPVMAALSDWFGPVLPRPFRVDALCLMAEDRDGRFHLRHRAALSG